MATEMELWLYQFRRRLRRASAAGKRMAAKGGSFRVEVKWDAQEGGAASYTTPEEPGRPRRTPPGRGR